MKISTKGRYAVRVMLDLAANDDGNYIPLKDVAARQGITLKYMEQIIILLKRAGYLQSTRGNGGGYRLARTPAEYKVGDIIRTTEGSLAPTSCLEEDDNPCERCNGCTTVELWKGLYGVITEYLDGITLQDLLDKYHDGTDMGLLI